MKDHLTTPSTRLQFLGRLTITAGAAILLSIDGTNVTFADAVTDFGSAVVGTEMTQVVFSGNALVTGSRYSVSSLHETRPPALHRKGTCRPDCGAEGLVFVVVREPRLTDRTIVFR